MVTLKEGLNELNVQLMPSVVIDFPDLMILDVEGIPFTNIGQEPVLTVDKFVAALEPCISMPEYTYPYYWGFRREYVHDVAVYLYECAQNYNPWADYNSKLRQIADFLRPIAQAHPEWLGKSELTVNPSTGNLFWYDHLYSFAQLLIGTFNLQGEIILTATLANPIVMDVMRGISMTVIGKEPLAKYIGVGHTIMTENYLWYEPQFSAEMPPPAFRGGGIIAGQLIRDELGRVTGVEFSPCVITASGRFAAGYYYPGIYDGRISVRWYPSGYGREYATYCDFRIKNLTKVTGKGTVV